MRMKSELSKKKNFFSLPTTHVEEIGFPHSLSPSTFHHRGPAARPLWVLLLAPRPRPRPPPWQRRRRRHGSILSITKGSAKRCGRTQPGSSKKNLEWKSHLSVTYQLASTTACNFQMHDIFFSYCHSAGKKKILQRRIQK